MRDVMSRGSGQMILLFGSLARLGVDFLSRLYLMGQGHRIGSVVIVEFGEKTGESIERGIPDEFRDRLVIVHCRALSQGLGNKPMSAVAEQIGIEEPRREDRGIK